VKSFRDFVKGTLLKKLLDDVKDRRIFNEADLQYRASHHLDKEYYPDLYLTNQPSIPIGRHRGKVPAKPDIVLYDETKGPQVAMELKCFIKQENLSFSAIADAVWKDIDKLGKFCDRYRDSRNAFALVFVNVGKELYEELGREFSPREEWMSHYLFIHVVNVLCDSEGRKRNWYNSWLEDMRQWNKYFVAS